MLQQTFLPFFEKDLNKLKEEISAYKSETDLWEIAEGTLNSGGNLCLHLVGNLKHFIGNVLGNIPYQRDRNKEFSDKNIPAATLIKNIEETLQAVTSTLPQLSDDDMNKIYPINVSGKEMTTASFLLFLYGHLNYHLGQINYHRRIVGEK